MAVGSSNHDDLHLPAHAHSPVGDVREPDQQGREESLALQAGEKSAGQKAAWSQPEIEEMEGNQCGVGENDAPLLQGWSAQNPENASDAQECPLDCSSSNGKNVEQTPPTIKADEVYWREVREVKARDTEKNVAGLSQSNEKTQQTERKSVSTAVGERTEATDSAVCHWGKQWDSPFETVRLTGRTEDHVPMGRTREAEGFQDGMRAVKATEKAVD